MDTMTSTSKRAEQKSVVAELEGVLLRDADPFPYFMLVAFEVFGLPRFAAVLFMWPLLWILRRCGAVETALRVLAFAALAGAKMEKVEEVARAVLPKFYVDDVDATAWRVFGRCKRRVVVTAWPKAMVEWFAKEHLGAAAVIGRELCTTPSGHVTGLFLKEKLPAAAHVMSLFSDGTSPDIGLGRPSPAQPFMSSCTEQYYSPVSGDDDDSCSAPPLPPVIFHDGRLVRRPTPMMSLVILLWVPLGILVAIVRIAVGLVVPIWVPPIIAPIFGGAVIVHGKPPPPVAPDSGSSGVLFVCTHRTLMDPVVLATVLGRKVPALTYSISRLSEILSPIPTIRLTRDRRLDSERIRSELEAGDLAVCPEGTTCREPFLLRFSALFAELTDRIVPVAMDYKVDFFHPTTARGWKAMDPIFFFMNPHPVYEVTFLRQLPAESTCTAGKTPYEVANHVQSMLATELGFECTSLTRKDKYRVLAGNDGSVGAAKPALPWLRWSR